MFLINAAESYISRFLYQLAAGLDHARAGILRVSLSNRYLRTLYVNRSTRLALLFVLSLTMTFVWAAYWPLLILGLGPFLWGIPHVFASIRYTSLATGLNQNLPDPKKLRLERWIFTVFIIIFGFIRCWMSFEDTHPLALAYRFTLWPEFLGCLGVLLVFSYTRGVGPMRYFGLTLWLGVLGLILNLPMTLLAVFSSAHNAVGFLYWYRLARTPQDRWVALGCLLLFIVASHSIYLGITEGWPMVGSFYPDPGQTIFGIEAKGTAKVFFTGLERLTFFDLPRVESKIVQIYAFGHALHYFVWLKAIPDQVHPTDAPASFREGLRSLQRDFGGKYLLMILGIIAAVYLSIFVLQFWQIRRIFFALSGFHGFLELAGIGYALTFGSGSLKKN